MTWMISAMVTAPTPALRIQWCTQSRWCEAPFRGQCRAQAVEMPAYTSTEDQTLGPETRISLTDVALPVPGSTGNTVARD